MHTHLLIYATVEIWKTSLWYLSQSKYITLVDLFLCQYNIVFDYTTFATSYILLFSFFFFDKSFEMEPKMIKAICGSWTYGWWGIWVITLTVKWPNSGLLCLKDLLGDQWGSSGDFSCFPIKGNAFHYPVRIFKEGPVRLSVTEICKVGCSFSFIQPS